jgi:hypothetical protein
VKFAIHFPFPLTFLPSKVKLLSFNILLIPSKLSFHPAPRAYFADACSETRPSLDPMIHCGLKPDNHGALNFLEEKKRKEKKRHN